MYMSYTLHLHLQIHLWKLKLISIVYRKYVHLCWMEKFWEGLKLLHEWFLGGIVGILSFNLGIYSLA